MFGFTKKEPAYVDIDTLNFLTDKAKEAFRVPKTKKTSELVGKEADNYYLDYCVESGGVADRVILCEIRAAVYFENTVHPDPKKLCWWYRKDTNTENKDLYNEK